MLERFKQWIRADSLESSDRGVIGRRGESEAADLLKAAGYRVLARNWRSGKDEIDLICWDGDALVFVEVRTRSKDAKVGGYDSIREKKRRALNRVCRAYLYQLRTKPTTHRFDVVEVEHDVGRVLSTRHYEDVPLFTKAVNRGS